MVASSGRAQIYRGLPPDRRTYSIVRTAGIPESGEASETSRVLSSFAMAWSLAA
jgi:hypothetical protein